MNKLKTHMSEEEIRARINEINNQRHALDKEKRKYEEILWEKERKNILEAHREFEGKYFITMNITNNTHKQIIAFKLLKVLDPPNERYAECVVLVNGIESNCWNVKAIKLQTLPIWCKNTNSMVSRDDEPRMIDMYRMVDEDKFIDLYDKYLENINSKLL